jgi:hypothetical protein
MQPSADDVDLILSNFGFAIPEDSPQEFGGFYAYAMAVIRDAHDDQLIALNGYLTGQDEQTPDDPLPWEAGSPRVFMSHLAAHQAFIGRVAYWLKEDGIAPFVAHTSIDVSSQWMVEIEKALLTCDATVVFLHDGFHASNWCDQEVGFAMARRVPIIPIELGVLPYGFMGKFQAMRGLKSTDSELADAISDRLATLPATKTKMTEGTVNALERSYSYARTRHIYARLTQLDGFTPDQLDRLLLACKNNNQVTDAFDESRRLIPELIDQFVSQRRR